MKREPPLLPEPRSRVGADRVRRREEPRRRRPRARAQQAGHGHRRHADRPARRGAAHASSTSLRQAPTAGVTLELTIDAQLQYIAERELRAAVEEHGAIGGTVVMMDPHTGEILALVSEPHFNPNDSSEGRSDVAHQSRRRDDLRAGLDVQDDHRGRRARGERHQADRHRRRDDAVPVRHRQGDHRRAPGRRGVVREGVRQVEQLRHGARRGQSASAPSS